VQQGRAFDEVVTCHREQPALRRPVNGVPRAADALEERRDAVRRPDLTHEIDVADVDAELEGGGRDERFEAPLLQALFGIQAAFLREAAVVRADGLLAEPVCQVSRDTLHHLPRVDEDERRAMAADQRRQAVVVFLPDLARHHGFERRARDLECQIQMPSVAGVDDSRSAPRRMDSTLSVPTR
jgi:hypothetical protein